MLDIDNASLYYETAGSGQPIVFIHAGVADSRQWDNEFARFAEDFQVVRYDMRGYGRSQPVAGDFRPIDDLTALLDHLQIEQPAILIGCSMGGTLAMDLALAQPQRVRALILVGSGPSGLQLDVPKPAKFKQAEAAFEAGDLALVCELETQIWFDGDRAAHKINQEMRALAYDMNLLALHHEVKNLGKRLPDADQPACDRLDELNAPVLAIVGQNDLPFMHAAVEVMAAAIADFQHVKIADAAHLPNMDHPEEFQRLVSEFIAKVCDP